jgi:hypothetical protein
MGLAALHRYWIWRQFQRIIPKLPYLPSLHDCQAVAAALVRFIVDPEKSSFTPGSPEALMQLDMFEHHRETYLDASTKKRKQLTGWIPDVLIILMFAWELSRIWTKTYPQARSKASKWLNRIVHFLVREESEGR